MYIFRAVGFENFNKQSFISCAERIKPFFKQVPPCFFLVFMKTLLKVFLNGLLKFQKRLLDYFECT